MINQITADNKNNKINSEIPWPENISDIDDL